jgi:hypothetical protein
MNPLSSLTSQPGESGPGILMSALSGVAAALAVAIILTIYFRTGYRTWRDVVRHGLAALAALGLLGFVVYDMHDATLAYLGLNPSKPAVEFELRLPAAILAAASDTEMQLHAEPNQTLARVADPVAPRDACTIRCRLL